MDISSYQPIAGLPRKRFDKIQQAAQELEAQFWVELLKTSASSGKSIFSGGAGEDQFESFLYQEQARAIAQSHSLGLAEKIEKSLKGESNG